MSPKEYLSQIKRLRVRIESMCSEKDELRRNMSVLSGIDYSQDRVQVSPDPGATFERTVDKIEAMEQEIDRKISEYVDLRRKIIGQIDALPDAEYSELLYKHYAEFKSLAKISGEIHYCYEWLRKMHGKALTMFGEMYDIGE